MKICPDCKDVILYCKCPEDFFTKQKIISEANILESLQKYISNAPGSHISMGKWDELYDLIIYVKPIEQCKNNVEITESKRILSFMNNNPPPERNFGPPSSSAPRIIRILLLSDQLNYALKIGKIKEIDKFIRNLKDEDWCC